MSEKPHSEHLDRLLGIPDEEIVRRIRASDERVFAELARAYVHPLYLWGSHHFDSEYEARDAISDVLTQLWVRRAELAVTTTVEAYLFGIIRRKALMMNRDSRRRLELLDDQVDAGETPGMSSFNEDPVQRVENLDARSRLQSAINKLPDNFRAVLQLKLERDMTYGEIASVLGITTSNAKKIASRAIQALREQLPPR